MRLTSKPLSSLASSGSQLLPQMHLDDVPAGAAEGGFQFLNDLAVAAHRAVEALQVAIDDEDQVVELFACRPGSMAPSDSGSSVSPSPRNAQTRCVGVSLHAAMFKIAIEAGLINGHDRREAHRYGGKLPEVGHQPGMRIATTARRPGASSRRKFSSWLSVSRPSRNARA